MINNYLSILEESLQRKILILDKISEYNLEQERLFKAMDNQAEAMVDFDAEGFDEYVQKKDELIQEVTRLDEGFETLYARISEQLNRDRAQYAQQISRLQELVRQVMEKSVGVQAQEARNKALVENYFKRAREGIRKSRKNSKAAYDYYKSMSSSSNTEVSQFMDTKQ